MEALSRSVLLSAVLFSSLDVKGQDAASADAGGFVKLTVRGMLVHENDRYNRYYIEAEDRFGYKLRVILERSEDKDHELDSIMERLEGSVITASGQLDFRGAFDESRVLYLEFGRNSLISYDKARAAAVAETSASTKPHKDLLSANRP